MTVRKCKFCGCNERHACSIPIRLDDDDKKFEIWFGAIVQLDIDIDYIPCGWLLQDVCTNPACVDKAYAEARELEFAVAIQGLIDLGLVKMSQDDDGGEDRLLLTDAGRFEAGLMRRTA